MNRKKRMPAGLCGIAFLSLAAFPVHAQGQSETTILQADVASDYTLTIPKATNIPFGSLSTPLAGKLKVTGNVAPFQTVTVEAEAKPLENAQQGTELAYTLMDGSGTYQTATWNEAQMRDGLGNGTGREVQLSVNILQEDWDNAEAGTYEGGIVFNAVLNH